MSRTTRKDARRRRPRDCPGTVAEALRWLANTALPRLKIVTLRDLLMGRRGRIVRHEKPEGRTP